MLKKSLKLTIYFLLFCIGLTVCSLIGLLLLNHTETINHVNLFIKKYQFYFALWRYFLMAIIIYFYPHFIRYLYANQQNSKQKIKKYSKRRYPLIVLILTEVLIVQNGLGWMVNKLIGL